MTFLLFTRCTATTEVQPTTTAAWLLFLLLLLCCSAASYNSVFGHDETVPASVVFTRVGPAGGGGSADGGSARGTAALANLLAFANEKRLYERGGRRALKSLGEAGNISQYIQQEESLLSGGENKWLNTWLPKMREALGLPPNSSSLGLAELEEQVKNTSTWALFPSFGLAFSVERVVDPHNQVLWESAASDGHGEWPRIRFFALIGTGSSAKVFATNASLGLNDRTSLYFPSLKACKDELLDQSSRVVALMKKEGYSGDDSSYPDMELEAHDNPHEHHVWWAELPQVRFPLNAQSWGDKVEFVYEKTLESLAAVLTIAELRFKEIPLNVQSLGALY